jgi:hypothetical protein
MTKRLRCQVSGLRNPIAAYWDGDDPGEQRILAIRHE